jgi:hypothetical protein
MSAQLTVYDLKGMPAPSGCTVTDMDQQDSQPLKEYVDDQGNSQPFQLKMMTTTLTMKGKGYPSMSLITLTLDAIASGAVYLTGLTIDEGPEEIPDFSMEAVIYS